MTDGLVVREIKIDEAADRGDSDSRMTSLEVIICHLNSNQLTLQKHYCKMRCIVSAGNS